MRHQYHHLEITTYAFLKTAILMVLGRLVTRRWFFTIFLLLSFPIITLGFNAAAASTANTTTATVRLDSRFISAIEGMNRLYPKEPPLSVTQSNNIYRIKQAEQVLYEFKDPDFYTLHQGLKLGISALMKQPLEKATRLELSRFENYPLTPHGLTAIIRLHNISAKYNNSSLKKVTDAMILLNFFADDTLDMMSILQADTWMLTAWLEVRSREQNDVRLAMLADNLGYEVYAEHAVLKAHEHPIQHFFQSAPITADSVFSRLLRVKKAAETHDASLWESSVTALQADKVGLSMMLQGVHSLERHRIRSKLLLLYPLMVYNDYLDNQNINQLLFSNGLLNTRIDNIDTISTALTKPIDFSPAFLIASFEARIKNEAHLPKTGVVSPDVLINYWQSRLLNAYYHIAMYLYQDEQNQKLAHSLSAVFYSNLQTQVGGLLYHWFDTLVSDDAYDKSVKNFTILANSSFRSLPLMRQLYDRQWFLYPTETDAYRNAEQFLLNALDSRYSHQAQRFNLLAKNKQIPKDFALDNYRYRMNKAFIDGLGELGDVELLGHALSLTEQSNEQAHLIGLIFQHGGGNETLFSQLSTLYRDNPSSFLIFKNYINVLLHDTQRMDEAIDQLDDWIVNKRDLSRKDYLELITLIARAKLASGDLDSAWKTVSPALSYQYPPSILAAADIALAQKQTEKTNKIIALYKKRFPSSLDSLAYQLRSLWLQQKYEVSLELIQHWYYQLNDEQFQEYVVDNLAEIKLDKENKTALYHAVLLSPLTASRRQAMQKVLN